MRFGPFILNKATSELTQNGEVVAIEPQSMRLWEFLISQRDRVVSRADLVDAIWYGRVVSDWAISGAVKALRSALGDLDVEKRLVRTVHSRGYRFAADVSTDAGAGSTKRRPFWCAYSERRGMHQGWSIWRKDLLTT